MLNKRKDILDEYKKLNISHKTMIYVALLSLLMALIIMCGPIVLFINLYIFQNIRYFATFMVAISIAFIYLLFNIFYYNGITKGSIKKIYYIYLPYNIIVSIIIYIIYIILRVRGIL